MTAVTAFLSLHQNQILILGYFFFRLNLVRNNLVIFGTDEQSWHFYQVMLTVCYSSRIVLMSIFISVELSCHVFIQGNQV